MPLPNTIPQEFVFFVEPWTQQLEETVIRKMASEYWEDTWIRGIKENNKRVMRIVRLDVKEDLGIDLPIEVYLSKLAQLEGRYNNFSKLIARDDVVYSEVHNTVQVSAETWWDIAETNPDRLVYMRRGEACWYYLKDLFLKVVEISDTTGQAAGHSRDSVQARSRSGSHSTGRHNHQCREVIQIPNSNSEDNMEFPRAIYISSDSMSNAHHQSSESRCESVVVNQSSYSLSSPSTRGFPNPSADFDSF